MLTRISTRFSLHATRKLFTILAFLFPVTLSAQVLSGTVVDPFNFTKTSSCNSQDLLAVGAYLQIQGGCGITCPSGQTTVNLPLILRINNKTGSTRTSVAIFAKLKVDGQYWPSAQSPLVISRCLSPTGGVPPSVNDVPWDVNIGNISVPCNGRLELSDIILAWTDASKTSTCEAMAKGVSPKCGLGGTIPIEKGFEVGSVSVTPNTNCSGTGNGSITYSFTGGATPYYYSLTGPNANDFSTTKPVLTNLSSGSFTVWAKDANNCPASFTRTIQNTGTAPSVTAGTIVSNSNCASPFNGSITFNISGGTAPYSWSTAENGTYTQLGSGVTTVTITGLNAGGPYYVYVKGANGCTGSASASVTNNFSNPAVVAGTPVPNSNCTGTGNGSITFSISGGTSPYAYSTTENGSYSAIGGSTVTLNGLSAGGPYYVYVKGANGCIGSASASVTNNHSYPSASASAFTNPSLCGTGNDGSITIAAVTGAEYKLTNTGGYSQGYQASNVFTGLTSGTYTLYVKNTATGCEASAPMSCQPVVNNSTASNTGAGRFLGSTEMTDPLIVKVSPNPFGNQARFQITSAVAGMGSLEIFNSQGQKIKTLYNGNISAGVNYFDLKMTGQQTSTLIYVFKMNGETISGKLIRGNVR